MNSKKQEINWKLIGASEHIDYLKREIEYVAKKIKILDMAVLISGPSGTGKELIANAIAEQSGRKPFVAINCAAFPGTLFESELFGYKKGAFTDAKKDKSGLIKEAEGGVLLLDEIGDLAPENQGKILRLLQERTFIPIGGKEERINDIRIIAATNKPLEKIREDLLYRLNHRIIETIPLKERRVDIICLVNHFVHKKNVEIKPKVKFLLYSYDFPGNVRELETLINSSDDFEYVKTALRKNVAAIIGIDLGFISRFKSLSDFDNKIGMDDLLDMTIEWRRNKRDKGGLSELAWREKLYKNPEANEFFRATFFAEENDCSEIVKMYEIITLMRCPELPIDDWAKNLHIKNEKVYAKFNETFGFDVTEKDENFPFSEPVKIYPGFVDYWKLRKLYELHK